MKAKIQLTIFPLLISLTVFSQTGNTNTGTNAGNSGNYNTSIGYYSGDLITSNFNTFLGAYSGKNTNGSLANDNFFGGYYSGLNNTSGKHNVFMGSNSGKSNLTGAYNTFMGSYSGVNAGSGNMNTFLGYFSGSGSSSGNNNMFIGPHSGSNNASGSGNIFLGYYSGYNETGSNKLYIENSNSSLPLIYGDFAADKLGINSLPNSFHTLTVGGSIHATGIYVNGVSLSDGGFEFWTKSGTNVWNNTGNVGIGTALTNNPNSYKLAVNGKLGAHEVQIENSSLTWPDFVFDGDYKLMSLLELETFIKTNKHLPEMPTEKEVKENGILLSEMNAKLLQKIEELTLHLIELKKEVEKFKTNSNESK